MTGQGTRFPIEVTLIEDHTYQIKSKIILDKNFNDLDRGKLDEFNNRQGLTRPMIKNEFVELLREVCI
jgi:hypothetical protein